eukprot:326522-Prorocentrum_lima.AAC.1
MCIRDRPPRAPSCSSEKPAQAAAHLLECSCGRRMDAGTVRDDGANICVPLASFVMASRCLRVSQCGPAL